MVPNDFFKMKCKFLLFKYSTIYVKLNKMNIEFKKNGFQLKFLTFKILSEVSLKFNNSLFKYNCILFYAQ